MYKLILAKRYFLRRRITLLAVMSVMVCVFIVLVVMTVMNGLVNDFRSKNHSYVGDCVISTDSLVGFAHYEDFVGELRGQDFIEAVSVVVSNYGLMSRAGRSRNIGILIVGIEPQDHCLATGFGKTIHFSRDNPQAVFETNADMASLPCIVGIDMMWWHRDRAGLYHHGANSPDIQLLLSAFPLTARGALAKAGTDLVNTREFNYVDDSHSGLVKVDARTVYVPFEYAQTLFGMAGTQPRISSIHLKFASGLSLNASCEQVRKIWAEYVNKHSQSQHAHLFDGVRVESWIENRRSIVATMEKEQIMLTFLFLMLGVITIFIVLVVFYVIVSHKSKDIGIMKSIGISSASIVNVFLLFAAQIGLFGSALGVLGGYLFLSRVNVLEEWLYRNFQWQLWDRSVYAIGKIPNTVEWHFVILVVGCAITACMIGAAIPSIQAARRRPVEILQVNQL